MSGSNRGDVAGRKQSINLLRGWPNTSLLPADLIKDAASAVLSDTSTAHLALLYGPDEGFQPARDAIAAWLTDFFKPQKAVNAERICITGGASQNLGVMLGVYSDPKYTRNVWIVAPAYMLAFRIFEDAGLGEKMRAVPEDEEGIDIEYLRREIQKSEEKAQGQGNTTPHFKPDRARAKVYKHIIYCVPSFSNPSSRTMSLRRRRELVQLARQYDALVTCDDVYDFLLWPADVDRSSLQTAHLPRVVDVDRELDGGTERNGADGFGNVQSNCTFSKLAGPGLRTGWVEGTEKFVFGLSQAGVQRSGGAPSHLTSTYLTKLIQDGTIQKHIQTVLCPAYASRYKTMMDAIDEHLIPQGFQLPQLGRDVIGGYFVWLGLPENLKASELADKCLEDENLVIAPGGIFEVPGDTAVQFTHHIRLCFAWEDESKLCEGVLRLAKVAKSLLGAKEEGSYVVVEREGGDALDTFK